MIKIEHLLPLDEGDPSADGRGFRRCLAQFATGVTVITTEVMGRRIGITANSFSSLSLDPPLIIWSIARSSRNLEIFESATHFAVNVLSDYQLDVSQRFASLHADKFEDTPWQPGRNGSPLLQGVAAQFECRKEVTYPSGDHIIIIGRVERYARFNCNVLLFAQGQYGIIDDHPNFKTEKKVNMPDDINIIKAEYTHPLSTLLFRAHHLASTEIERHRREEGLTIAQARVLYLLTELDAGLSLEKLAAEIFLPEPVTEDAVSDMIKCGQVESTIEGLIRLTVTGRENWTKMRLRDHQYHSNQMKGINDADIEAGRRFLSMLIENHNCGVNRP